MNAWSLGADKALGVIAGGFETRNGSMAQLGLDRLQTRAQMDEDLGACFPNAFGESVQEGVAKAWHKKMDEAAKQGHTPPAAASWQSTMEDHAWMLGILSKQDEWSKVCVEEAVRLMAFSAARALPHVVALVDMNLDDCVSAASSFFTALTAYDRLSRIAQVDEEAQKAVGEMLLAWEVDEASLGKWTGCRGLSSLSSDPQHPEAAWPSSAGVRASSIVSAIASVHEGVDATKPVERQYSGDANRGRRAPRG